ncbi:hypothetical protein C8D88_105387 [Lentzea atacamensis]|uniref:Uncharacterized protein n=1 Tax=Lentzea atacamensis TaxID=531938 RepID=A0A316HYE6_9PSEU|nr:hypothetical protein C8D88_105387 [Lentzea atacamensis]
MTFTAATVVPVHHLDTPWGYLSEEVTPIPPGGVNTTRLVYLYPLWV